MRSRLAVSRFRMTPITGSCLLSRFQSPQCLTPDVFPILACHFSRRSTSDTLQQERLQLRLGLVLLVVSDEFADVFADAAVASGGNLVIHELLERFRDRNVHGLH